MSSAKDLIPVQYLEELLDMLATKNLMHTKIEGVGEFVFAPTMKAVAVPNLEKALTEDESGRRQDPGPGSPMSRLFPGGVLPEFPKRPEQVAKPAHVDPTPKPAPNSAARRELGY